MSDNAHAQNALQLLSEFLFVACNASQFADFADSSTFDAVDFAFAMKCSKNVFFVVRSFAIIVTIIFTATIAAKYCSDNFLQLCPPPVPSGLLT